MNFDNTVLGRSLRFPLHCHKVLQVVCGVDWYSDYLCTVFSNGQQERFYILLLPT